LEKKNNFKGLKSTLEGGGDDFQGDSFHNLLLCAVCFLFHSWTHTPFLPAQQQLVAS
jgi:hypothetical protein